MATAEAMDTQDCRHLIGGRGASRYCPMCWEELHTRCAEAGRRVEELHREVRLWEACGASHKRLKELFAPLLYRAEAAEAKLAKLREILRIEARHDTAVRTFSATLLSEIDADAKEE